MRADLWMDKSKEIQSLSTGKNSVVVSGRERSGYMPRWQSILHSSSDDLWR